MPSFTFPEPRFFGLDVAAHAEDLPPGFLQQADNVFLDGPAGQGGNLITRPGLQGVFTVPINKQIRNGIAYRNAAGVQCVVFVCGGATDGEIRYWPSDQTTATALPALGTFNALTTQFATVGQWIYISGNLDGILRRTNLLTSETAAGLITPTYSLSASLQSRVVLPIASATGWGYDTVVGTPVPIVNGNFAAGSGSSSVTAWDFSNGANDRHNDLDDATGYWYLADDIGSYAITDNFGTPYPNIAKTNVNGIGSTARKGVHFNVSFSHIADDNDAQDTPKYFYLGLDVYSDAAGLNQVGRIQKEYRASYGTPSTQQDIFSFANTVTDTEIASYNLEVGAGPNNPSGVDNPYVSNLNVAPYQPPVLLSNVTGGIGVGVQPVGLDPKQVYLGDQHLVYAIPATNFSTYRRIALRFSRLTDFTGLQVKLGFGIGSSGVITYTDNCGEATDGLGGTYLVADLSTIPVASRQNITRFVVYFLNDLTLTEADNNGQAVLTIGDFSEAGNLSVNYADYAWRATEKRGGIQSGAGPISNTVTPTVITAQGQITFGTPFPQNSGSSVVLWRQGGTFGDGYFRQEAEFSPLIGTITPTWSFDAATRTFTDNIPDGDLTGANLLVDHNAPPLNPIAIGEFAGRLGLATTEAVYLSQLRYGVEAGLYFNNINDPNSPDRAIEGFYSTLVGPGGYTGDTVQRLVSYQNRLVILLQRAVYTLAGTSVDDYTIRRSEFDEGKGLVAPHAVWTFGGALYFLSSDSLRRYADGQMPVVSQKIARLLNPATVFGGDGLSAPGYRDSWMVASADRLYLGVPEAPGVLTPNVAFALDPRFGDAWTRQLFGTIYGGVNFDGDNDTHALYLYGGGRTPTDGMIYAFGPDYGDIPSLAYGTPLPVPIVVKSRKYTSENRNNDITAERFGAVVNTDDVGENIDMTVQAEDKAAKTWQASYALSQGETEIRRLKVGNDVRGRTLVWTIEAETVNPLKIEQVGLLATDGRIIV